MANNAAMEFLKKFLTDEALKARFAGKTPAEAAAAVAGGCRNSVLIAGNDYYGIDPALCAFFENGWDQRIRDAAQSAFEAYLKRNPPMKEIVQFGYF